MTTFVPGQTLTAAEMNNLVPPNSALVGGDGTVFSAVAVGTGLALTSGTLTAGGGSVTSVVTNASPYLNAGTITTAGTITAATLAASSLIGNAATTGAIPTAIAIGSNLTLSTGGTLSASAPGTGTVTQVVAQGGPFLANGTITTSGTISNSTTSLTTHGVVIGEGTSAVVATAAMTNGQLLVGATGADPAPQTVSGDATINSTAVLTLGTTGVTAASYGDSTHATNFTVDAKGRLTAASSVAIPQGTVTQIVAGSNLTGGTITSSGTIALQASPTITVASTTVPVVLNANTAFAISGLSPVLQITGPDASVARVELQSFAGQPQFTGRRAQGTQGSPTGLVAGNTMGGMGGAGYGATGYSSASRVNINLQAAETWSDTAQGSQIVFQVTANGGTAIATAMQLQNGGILTIGTTVSSGSNKLQVVGGATIDSLVIGSSTAITALGSTLIETSGTLNINLGSVNSWTAAQRSVPVSLTSAATVTPDFSASNNFAMTMTVSGTLANPTNVVAGQAGQFAITQDGTGGRTLALGSVFKTAAGAGITLTTTAAATDILSYYVWNSTLVAISPKLNFK